LVKDPLTQEISHPLWVTKVSIYWTTATAAITVVIAVVATAKLEREGIWFPLFMLIDALLALLLVGSRGFAALVVWSGRSCCDNGFIVC
jgi:hypothetical protein